MPLVFVYGTLMRAGANHAVLARLGSRYFCAARTREPRTLVDLGPYPALLPARRAASPPATCIEGEVWEIDDEALRELDAFEGCPELYTRERIGLVSSDGEELDVFVYTLAIRPPRHARVIESGRYAAAGTALPEGASPEQLVGAPFASSPPATRARRR